MWPSLWSAPRRPALPFGTSLFSSYDSPAAPGDEGEQASHVDEKASHPDATYGQFRAEVKELQNCGDIQRIGVVVMRRFNSLLASDVFVNAHRRREALMVEMCRVLDSVFKNGLFKAYTDNPEGFASERFPYPEKLNVVFDPIVTRYFFNDRAEFKRSARVFFAYMLGISTMDTQVGGPCGRAIAAATGPWIAVNKVKPDEYLARLNQLPWYGLSEPRIEIAYNRAACHGGWHAKQAKEEGCDDPVGPLDPTLIANAEVIVNARGGNLGLEFVFPYGDPWMSATHNWLMFGNPPPQRKCVRLFGGVERTAVIAVAIRAFLQIGDTYFKAIDKIDAAGHMGDRNVAAITAGYATLPFEIPLNMTDDAYRELRDFMTRALNSYDTARRARGYDA